MKRILLLGPVAGRMDMRRTVVLSALAAVAVLLVGVAALLWTQPSQAQEPCTIDLCIDKTANPNTVKVGQQITFTIRERCFTEEFCTSVIPIVDVLPSGLTIVSVDDNQPDYQCSTSGNTVTCPGGHQPQPALLRRPSWRPRRSAACSLTRPVKGTRNRHKQPTRWRVAPQRRRSSARKAAGRISATPTKARA